VRLAHSTADILVSPLNDSFLDLDVLAMVDPVTFAVNRGQSLCGDGARYAALPPIDRRGPHRLRGSEQPSFVRSVHQASSRPLRQRFYRARCTQAASPPTERTCRISFAATGPTSAGFSGAGLTVLASRARGEPQIRRSPGDQDPETIRLPTPPGPNRTLARLLPQCGIE
jgi:hypothetical protein